MNRNEAIEQVKQLAKLFAPQMVTKEQAEFAAKEFSAFPQKAVASAIADHRRTHEFINWPQLFEGCRAAERGQGMELKVYTAKECSRADIIRRQCRYLTDVKDDREVYLRYYQGEWHEYEKRRVMYGDEYLSRQMKRIGAECALHLVETKMDQAKAKEWAAMIFASPDHFKLALGQLRG